MIEIHGAIGEGGGQVLRTSLGLSAALGEPVRITDIRAKRKKPGLLRQHLTSAKAVARICQGELSGAELGSTELELRPNEPQAGDYSFMIGSAGGTMLVLQAILPALLRANGPSTVEIEGGTHNPMAPPTDFIQETLSPVLARSGARLEVELVRAGFYPAGGGLVRVKVWPTPDPKPLELLERGERTGIRGVIHGAHLHDEVYEKESAALIRQRQLRGIQVESRQYESRGPGNAITAHLDYPWGAEVLTAYGEKDKRSAHVVSQLGQRVHAYESASAPVGEHLADQLMAPLAAMAGGRYRATLVTSHARTNAKVMGLFRPGIVQLDWEGPEECEVKVAGLFG